MRSVAILLFCIIFVSCLPLQVLFTGSDASNSDKVLGYRELDIYYQLAFEESIYKNYDDLSQLVDRTQLSLDRGKLTAEQQAEVRRWQHKLRSFLAFALLAMHKDAPADIAGDTPEATTPPPATERERVQGLAYLILDELRTADVTRVNPEQSNSRFYQQIKAGEHGNEKLSQQAKDNFSRALINESLALNEKSVRKYYRLFPFAQQRYAAICKEVAAADCQHLQMQSSDDDFQEQPFASVEQVSAEVNKAITDLNSIITMLTKLKATKDVFVIFKETDFDNVHVMRLYHAHERIIFNAARRGIFPIFVAPTFRKKAGNIYLKQKGGLDILQRLGLQKDRAHAAGEIKHKLLTEASHAVVEQSITEMQRATIKSWVTWRELKSNNKTFSDKDLYQQSIANEIATAQVIMQEPVHGIVVTSLLNRFQTKGRSPALINLIRRVTEIAELASLPLIFGGSAALVAIFPPLAAVGLVGKAIVVATAANFVWVGLAGAETALAHKRWLQLERALLTGSSERYEDGLKLLREFNKVRRDAIISGTIGLPMSVPSLRYALNHVYDGAKATSVDAISGVFAGIGEFNYENKSDLDLHQNK